MEVTLKVTGTDSCRISFTFALRGLLAGEVCEEVLYGWNCGVDGFDYSSNLPGRGPGIETML